MNRNQRREQEREEEREQLEMKKELSKLEKSVVKSNWKCMIKGCCNPAINSHLLMQNGILSNVAERGHLIEIKQKNPFKAKPSSIAEIKKLGIKDAFSLPLFCDSTPENHDSKFFKEVETSPFDFTKYKNQLLLSFRAICALIRRYEIVVKYLNAAPKIVEKYFKSISNALEKIGINYKDLSGSDDLKESSRLSINYLTFYKDSLEKEILNPANNFTFAVYHYPLVKVYASAIIGFTNFPDMNESERKHLLDHPEEMRILEKGFIHAIPYNSKLTVISGYHNEHVNPLILQYIDSWQSLSNSELEIKLTELVTLSDSFGISPALMKNIPQATIAEFEEYWSKYHSSYPKPQPKFNLFKNSISEV